MIDKLKLQVVVGAVISALLSLSSAAYANRPDIDHVLLISVDGMHAVDLTNCANGIRGVNGGKPYCPHLADLMKIGVNYVATSTSKPSDSFPGLMTIVTGATPRTMGVYYDVAYDRSLNPPAQTSGNGNPGGRCTPGATPPGSSTEYDEGIDIDKTRLNGGALSGDGGVNSINPAFLVRTKDCHPVYPWNFVRTDTIFGVIHSLGGYTAWSDKHPSYSSVGGPNGGQSVDTNVDDYYGPEINSNSQDYVSSDIVAPIDIVPACSTNGKPSLPDQVAVTAGDDYTGSFLNIQCYDGIKVQAVLNEINGQNHNGTHSERVPNIFGMNFQAVSIGQKLIYQHGNVPDPADYSQAGGYLDSIGRPSPSLFQEILFVDKSIGAMVENLKKRHLGSSTLIIVTAKHGQSPIDTGRYIRDGSNDPATILSDCIPTSESPAGLGPTEDDVALLWLKSSCNTATEVEKLELASPALPLADNIAGIGEIFSGPPLAIIYNTPGVGPNEDPRTPDIIVTPNIGVTYSNSTKKQAEHGGFSHDDTNVILLVANPNLTSTTLTSPVETAQIAPTILKALGIHPSLLAGVREEGARPLPGLVF
jgi:Type I phosphodiesterase / nucleotide pyrophosphatase